jgi:hypothetical protein
MHGFNKGLVVQEDIFNDGLWFSVYDGDSLIESFRFRDDAEAYLSFLERADHFEDHYL